MLFSKKKENGNYNGLNLYYIEFRSFENMLQIAGHRHAQHNRQSAVVPGQGCEWMRDVQEVPLSKQDSGEVPGTGVVFSRYNFLSILMKIHDFNISPSFDNDYQSKFKFQISNPCRYHLCFFFNP